MSDNTGDTLRHGVKRIVEDERVQDGLNQIGKAFDLVIGAIVNPKAALQDEVDKEAEEEDRSNRTVARVANGVTVEVAPGIKSFCTGCGQRLIISHKFCGSCGAKV